MTAPFDCRRMTMWSCQPHHASSTDFTATVLGCTVDNDLPNMDAAVRAGEPHRPSRYFRRRAGAAEIAGGRNVDHVRSLGPAEPPRSGARCRPWSRSSGRRKYRRARQSFSLYIRDPAATRSNWAPRPCLTACCTPGLPVVRPAAALPCAGPRCRGWLSGDCPLHLLLQRIVADRFGRAHPFFLSPGSIRFLSLAAHTPA